MASPRYYVVARVVSREGALPLWKERLTHLCAFAKTERYADSYYWASDLNGEPDTLWGLEGYSHPYGFFIDHVSSDLFKREMALVDKDKLLRTQQGITSPDYDLRHYDEAGGFLLRPGDANYAATSGHVAVLEFFAGDKYQRATLLAHLTEYAKISMTKEPASSLQSCLVLREVNDDTVATLWLRTPTREAFDALYTKGSLAKLLADVKGLITKTQLHHSSAFAGHIGLTENARARA